MESEELLDFYKEEATGRIFSLLFNSSNLISPAYAAAVVLGISFAMAALVGLLYYGLTAGGGGSGGGGYGDYSVYFQREYN